MSDRRYVFLIGVIFLTAPEIGHQILGSILCLECIVHFMRFPSKKETDHAHGLCV
jgi:hypothetical protein